MRLFEMTDPVREAPETGAAQYAKYSAYDYDGHDFYEIPLIEAFLILPPYWDEEYLCSIKLDGESLSRYLFDGIIDTYLLIDTRGALSFYVLVYSYDYDIVTYRAVPDEAELKLLLAHCLKAYRRLQA